MSQNGAGTLVLAIIGGILLMLLAVVVITAAVRGPQDGRDAVRACVAHRTTFAKSATDSVTAYRGCLDKQLWGDTAR